MAPFELMLEFRPKLGRRDANFLKQFRDEAFRLVDEGQQQVLAIQFLVGIGMCQPLRFLQCLLRFDG